MDLREVERRHAELKHRFEAGIIGVDDFNAERQRLMVQDEEGRWWAKSPNDDAWNYYDGSAWVSAAPPGGQEAISEPIDPSAQASSLSHPKGEDDGGNGRRGTPLWITVIGLSGIVFVVMTLLAGVLMQYLRNEQEPGEQSKSMGSSEQSDPMKSQQGGSAPDSIAFDAAFVHSATSENISGNSTYMDNPLTNSHPNALVYVTGNWNPGGKGSTYNEHPVGVWYDTKRQKWAIYNQDKAPMDEGAAFNVAILEEAKGVS